MKKILVLLSVLTIAVTGYSQPSPVKVTAVQRAGYAIDTTDFYLNPLYIQYITPGTNPLVGYINVPKADSVITYKAVSTQLFDTLVNRCNKTSATIVKLKLVSKIANVSRDTAIFNGFPLTKFVETKAKTDAAHTLIHATVGAKQDNKAGYVRWDIFETPAAIKTRIDSLIRVARDSTF